MTGLDMNSDPSTLKSAPSEATLKDRKTKFNSLLNKTTRLSTKLPSSHFGHTAGGKSRAEQTIIGLDKNCMTCSDPHSNEAVLKSFKIACLSYHPSTVKFEKTDYSRPDLIQSKQILMKYCLDQLRHLDLGNIDDLTSRRHVEINPRHVP